MVNQTQGLKVAMRMEYFIEWQRGLSRSSSRDSVIVIEELLNHTKRHWGNREIGI